MELRDIEYFAVVAEHRNLGRAAEALGLSTPALSKSLRRLEKSIQAKLVNRTPKGVEVTAEGAALLSHIGRLRISLQDITREIAELSRGGVGYLRIGANARLIDDLVTAASSALFKDTRNVTLNVTVGDNDVLVPALRTGELDLIVAALPTVPLADLVHEHVSDDEFVAYASATHRLSALAQLSIADLAHERWAVPAANTQAWQQLRRAFEDSGLAPPKVAMVSVSISLKLRTVASTDLLGLTSRRVLREAARHLPLAELRVEELRSIRRDGVSYRRDSYLSPAGRRFVELVKSAARAIAKDQA